MDDNKIKVEINVESKTEGAKKANKDLKNLSGTAKEVHNTLKSFSKVDFFAHLTQGIVNSAMMLNKISGAFEKFTKQIISLNSDFEKMNNKLTSLIFASNKSSTIDPFAKWQASGEKAKKIKEELKKLDTELNFSQNELTAMFLSFFSTASSSMSVEKATEVFKKISYAAQVSGADVNSLIMTLDSLGAGKVNTATDFGRFLSGQGLDTQMLTDSIKNGNFGDVLIKSLTPFEEASKMAGASFESLASSVTASFDTIKREAGEQMFEQIKKSFDNLNEYLNSDAGALKDAITNLANNIGDVMETALTPENIEIFASAMTNLIDVISGTVSALRSLSDVMLPDYLYGEENFGFTDMLKRDKDNLFVFTDELGDAVGKIFGAKNNSDLMEDFRNNATSALEDIKVKIKEIGGEFNGVGLSADNVSADNAKRKIQEIDAALQSIKKDYDETRNATLAWYRVDDQGKTLANLENAMNALKNYKEALKEAQKEKIDEEAAAAAAIAAENENLLNTFLANNKKRLDAHEKTLQSMQQKEINLVAKLEEAENKKLEISQKYANKRASLALNKENKLADLDQLGMDENGKFYDNLRRYHDAVENIKKSLSSGDTSAFERYLELAKNMSERIGTGVKLPDGRENLAGIAAYKARIEELNSFELAGINNKENAEMSAHNEKMNAISAELAATKAKIQTEMTFYTEMQALQNKKAEGKIDFGAEGFEQTKQKIAELENLSRQIDGKDVKMAVDADTNRAKEDVESIKKDISATKPVMTIEPDDKAVRKTIADISRNTSSTHTIYVKKVEKNAIGGLIGAYKKGGLIQGFAGGGLLNAIFKRRKNKISGHDLSGKDDVPAMLTKGEFVQNVRAVDYYGVNFMRALNARAIPKALLPHFASGGLLLNAQKTKFFDELKNSKNATLKKRDVDFGLLGDLTKFIRELFLKKQKILGTAFGAYDFFKKAYPDFYSVNSARSKGIAKWREHAEFLLKNAGKNDNAKLSFIGFNPSDIAKYKLKNGGLVGEMTDGFSFPKFSAGGEVLGGIGGKKGSYDINLNFNLNDGQKVSVLSDEETAHALERYFKSFSI